MCIRDRNKEVPLKSGGYLVIDQTEAMTTVDVNTGSFLGPVSYTHLDVYKRQDDWVHLRPAHYRVFAQNA